MSAPLAPLVVAHPNHYGSMIEAVQHWLAQPRTVLGLTVWPGWQVPDALAYPLGFAVAAGIMLGLVSLVAIVMIYLERKVAGHIQSRLGPMRVGWHGILQSFADGVKLLMKEDIIPIRANRFLFSLAPALVMVGAFMPFAALPFADGLVFANLDLGLFYILGFASLEVIGVIMAGWASSSKWSLFGGMRLAAQMLSYEIPLGLSVLVVAVMAGSLNLTEITHAQATLPFVLQSPFAFIGFFVFYIAALANTKRAPFDLPEAESELVSGFHTEYSGMRFSFFFLAEYAAMALVSAVGAILFLGGWNFPLLGEGRPVVGLMQLGLKTSALLFMMLWLRWTLPRVRIDQVMYLCLKVLLPISMFCLLGAGFQVVAGMALPLWGAVAALAAVTYLIGRRSPVASAAT